MQAGRLDDKNKTLFQKNVESIKTHINDPKNEKTWGKNIKQMSRYSTGIIAADKFKGVKRSKEIDPSKWVMPTKKKPFSAETDGKASSLAGTKRGWMFEWLTDLALNSFNKGTKEMSLMTQNSDNWDLPNIHKTYKEYFDTTANFGDLKTSSAGKNRNRFISKHISDAQGKVKLGKPGTASSGFIPSLAPAPLSKQELINYAQEGGRGVQGKIIKSLNQGVISEQDASDIRSQTAKGKGVLAVSQQARKDQAKEKKDKQPKLDAQNLFTMLVPERMG